jgi:hypothetical protein
MRYTRTNLDSKHAAVAKLPHAVLRDPSTRILARFGCSHILMIEEIWSNHISNRVGHIRLREFRTVDASKMLRAISPKNTT